MITEHWVRIPVRIQDIVLLGIGSAKIDKLGSIEITTSMSDFGQEMNRKVRSGEIEGFMLVPIPSTPREGDISG